MKKAVKKTGEIAATIFGVFFVFVMILLVTAWL